VYGTLKQQLEQALRLQSVQQCDRRAQALQAAFHYEMTQRKAVFNGTIGLGAAACLSFTGGMSRPNPVCFLCMPHAAVEVRMQSTQALAEQFPHGGIVAMYFTVRVNTRFTQNAC